MKAYKLLNQDLKSFNDTQWEIGKTITIDIPGNEMCTNKVLHYYNHPVLAILLNPIHANIKNPRLFEIEVDDEVNSDGLKFASKSQTLIKEIPIPEISIEQKVEIAIRIVKTVYFDEQWNQWADKWLDGSDRTKESAFVVVDATFAAFAAAAADAADTYAAAAWTVYAVVYLGYAVYPAHAVATVAIAAKSVNVVGFNKQLIDTVELVIK